MAQDLKEMDYNAYLEGYTKQPGDRKRLLLCSKHMTHLFTKACLMFLSSLFQKPAHIINRNFQILTLCHHISDFVYRTCHIQNSVPTMSPRI